MDHFPVKRNFLFLFVLILSFGCQHSSAFSSSEEKSKLRPVGILAALPQELENLKGGLTDIKVVKHGDEEFVLGVMGDIPVVSTLSGVGKVNAAIASQRLISEFSVKAIIFTGVGGGLNPKYEIGDVIVVTKTFQHDFGWLDSQFVLHAAGTLPEIGIGKGDEPIQMDLSVFWPPFGTNQTPFFGALAELTKKAQNGFSKVNVNDKEYRPQIRFNGVVATGDQFIALPAKKVELQKLGGDVVEMEGGAVAQVAFRNRIPCLIIRSISDKAGRTAKLDFSKFLQVVARNNEHLISVLFHSDSFVNYIQQF